LINSLDVARAIHFVAMMMLEGAIVFRFFVAEPSLRGIADTVIRDRLLYRFVAWTVWLGLLVGVASGVVWLVLLAASLSHVAPAQAISRGIAWIVLTRTQFGATWQARSVIAVLFAASVVAFDCTALKRFRWRRIIQLALVIALVGSLAWAGHGAATPGLIGDVQLIGDVLHLIVAGIWIGGLLPLAALLAIALRADEPAWIVAAGDGTRRFTILGVTSVLTLLLTGCVNTYVLTGSVPALVGTPYGRLLLLKIALFIAMVAIAAVNRQYLTPRLASASALDATTTRRPLVHLVRNSLTEFALGVLTLGIVGILGTLTPGLHDQPVWPFPIRFSADAFDDPDLLIRVSGAIVGISVAALAALAAIWARRLRWPLIAGAILVAGYFAPALSDLTEEAYPTSFFSSPTGYSAKSIALGHNAFLNNCAVCHGSRGRGDGPAAQSLTTKPADLTAEHIYGHLDGDLFWWITHGIGGVMPAFGDVLDETARWNLIDFIHANADAMRLRAAAGRVTSFGFPLPNFSVECPDGSVRSTDELKGRILHLVFSGPHATNRLRALPDFEGKSVVRIAILPDSENNNANACITSDRFVDQLFAIYHSGTIADSSDTEWLVDGSGSLRAIWWPGNGDNWRNMKVLQRRLSDLRRISAVVRTAGGHSHHH
jgi:putative copper export protein/mono/diheme cytochrome c family protein